MTEKIKKQERANFQKSLGESDLLNVKKGLGSVVKQKEWNGLNWKRKRSYKTHKYSHGQTCKTVQTNANYSVYDLSECFESLYYE